MERIKRAIDEKKNFLVILSIPLLPGFEGDITDSTGELLRIQVDWHLKSIRGLIDQVQHFIAKSLN